MQQPLHRKVTRGDLALAPRTTWVVHRIRFAPLLVAAALLAASWSFIKAQPALTLVVQLSNEGYLVDGGGRSLYVYLRDGADGSACTGVCAQNWPPVLADERVSAGPGIDPKLIGYLVRDDGSRQVTYNGWPLYYYARDREPGHTFGHGLGQVFYLVSAAGEALPFPLQAASSEPVGGVTVAEQDAKLHLGEEWRPVMELGQRLFSQYCAVCHGSQGEGRIGPKLAESNSLRNAPNSISVIIHGRPEHGMPAWGAQFSDEEIAAIVTFIRNSWGNNYGPTTPAEVADRR